MLVCFGISFHKLVVGYALAATVAALLTVQFALRVQASKKMMPAGMLMMVSGLTPGKINHEASS